MDCVRSHEFPEGADGNCLKQVWERLEVRGCIIGDNAEDIEDGKSDRKEEDADNPSVYVSKVFVGFDVWEE